MRIIGPLIEVNMERGPMMCIARDRGVIDIVHLATNRLHSKEAPVHISISLRFVIPVIPVYQEVKHFHFT